MNYEEVIFEPTFLHYVAFILFVVAVGMCSYFLCILLFTMVEDITDSYKYWVRIRKENKWYESLMEGDEIVFRGAGGFLQGRYALQRNSDENYFYIRLSDGSTINILRYHINFVDVVEKHGPW